MNSNDPAPVVADDAIVPAANPANAPERSDRVFPAADAVAIEVVPYEAEPPPAAIEAPTETQPPVGTSDAPINAALIDAVMFDPPPTAVVTPTFTVTAALTAGADVTTVALTAVTSAAIAAFEAGAETTRLEPSAATATSAMRFFNEIVFTIFLSFSQTKDDLLSGW